MTYKYLEIKDQAWNILIKRSGVPKGSVAADDIQEQSEEAIDTAILLTAQAIFSEIKKSQKTRTILGIGEPYLTGLVTSTDLTEIEDKWLHNACDFCETRKPSVIQRKDGKRICARCEVIEDAKKKDEAGIGQNKEQSQ